MSLPSTTKRRRSWVSKMEIFNIAIRCTGNKGKSCTELAGRKSQNFQAPTARSRNCRS
jgi:hypothetical protein